MNSWLVILIDFIFIVCNVISESINQQKIIFPIQISINLRWKFIIICLGNIFVFILCQERVSTFICSPLLFSYQHPINQCGVISIIESDLLNWIRFFENFVLFIRTFMCVTVIGYHRYVGKPITPAQLK